MYKDTLSKEEIARIIAAESGYPINMVRNVVDMVPIVIKTALKGGRRVQLNNFGSFEMKRRAPRTGRNPHTRAAVPIPARIMPVFKPSPALIEEE